MRATQSLFKKISIDGFINARVLKDHAKRLAVAENEAKRQALRFVQSREPPLPIASPYTSQLI